MSHKTIKPTLFDAVGGLPALQRVHTSFYDQVYAHPWLGQFFIGHNQQTIELRQTQFMAEKMGSKTIYPGKDLDIAHKRMYITEELLTLRRQLLREALVEEGLCEALIKRWLKIDQAFWGKISNDSLQDFQSIDLKYEQAVMIDKPELMPSSDGKHHGC